MKYLIAISVLIISISVVGCGTAPNESISGQADRIGQPLSKVAVARHGTSPAVVVATVSRDGAAMTGAMVEFSRSIAGRAPEYAWSGTTDETGQVTVEIAAPATGYYLARVSADGAIVGRWSSIPINGGYKSMVALPVGGKARVMGKESLPDANGFAGANFVNGGEMYDKWWVVAGLSAPSTDHPLWARQTTNLRSGADTHRCKECHGWDYKGVDGVYGSGSHRTGFPGILGTTKSPQEVFDLLKGHHGYGALGLNDTALWDITKFVLDGAIDTDRIIDQERAFIGDGAGGEARYTESCVSCHGADGLGNPFDLLPGQPGASPDYEDFPPKVAIENPWEYQHKVRFGQPGTDMPRLADENITLRDLANLGVYTQSLAK